jgi:antitoxin component of MazEF toxin-antitoxin module
MKLTKKVMQWGNSLGIILDKVVLEKLKVKKGDLVEVEVKKIK